MKMIDWDIIERKLEGGLSPEEEKAFQDWYAAKDEHRAYFRKVEKFEREDRFAREVPDEKVTDSWRAFKRRHITVRRRRAAVSRCDHRRRKGDALLRVRQRAARLLRFEGLRPHLDGRR